MHGSTYCNGNYMTWVLVIVIYFRNHTSSYNNNNKDNNNSPERSPCTWVYQRFSRVYILWYNRSQEIQSLLILCGYLPEFSKSCISHEIKDLFERKYSRIVQVFFLRNLFNEYAFDIDDCYNIRSETDDRIRWLTSAEYASYGLVLRILVCITRRRYVCGFIIVES